MYKLEILEEKNWVETDEVPYLKADILLILLLGNMACIKQKYYRLQEIQSNTKENKK